MSHATPRPLFSASSRADRPRLDAPPPPSIARQASSNGLYLQFLTWIFTLFNSVRVAAACVSNLLRASFAHSACAITWRTPTLAAITHRDVAMPREAPRPPVTAPQRADRPRLDAPPPLVVRQESSSGGFYLQFLTWTFTLFNSVRVFAYLPTLWAIYASGDSSQHSLLTWLSWFGANATMAVWLYEHNGHRMDKAIAFNIGNATMCLGTSVLIMVYRFT